MCNCMERKLLAREVCERGIVGIFKGSGLDFGSCPGVRGRLNIGIWRKGRKLECGRTFHWVCWVSAHTPI